MLRTTRPSDDDPRYEQAVHIHVRSVTDFPHLETAIDRLTEWIQPERRAIDRFIVFGGFLRGALASREFNDIDVVAGSRTAHRGLVALRGLPVDCFRRADRSPVVFDVPDVVFSCAAQIINRTDFTMAQIAYLYPDRTVHHASSFFEDTACRLLVAAPSADELPLQSFVRACKFVDDGFRCDAESLASVVTRYRRLPFWRRLATHLLLRSSTSRW